MLSELHTAHKVIGVKQSKKAIRDGAAAQVFVAQKNESLYRFMSFAVNTVWKLPRSPQ